MTVVEPISESEHPLVVVLKAAAVHGVSTLKEVARPLVLFEVSSQKVCRGSLREG